MAGSHIIVPAVKNAHRYSPFPASSTSFYTIRFYQMFQHHYLLFLSSRSNRQCTFFIASTVRAFKKYFFIDACISTPRLPCPPRHRQGANENKDYFQPYSLKNKVEIILKTSKRFPLPLLSSPLKH